MIKYDIESLSSLNLKTRKELMKLTLGNKGEMVDAIKSNQPLPFSFAIDEKINKIIGWCVVLDYKNVKKDQHIVKLAYVGLFVNPNYRRQGIGKNLITELGNFLKDKSDYIVTIAHTDENLNFFKNIGGQDWKDAPEDDWDTHKGRRLFPLKEIKLLWKLKS